MWAGRKNKEAGKILYFENKLARVLSPNSDGYIPILNNTVISTNIGESGTGSTGTKTTWTSVIGSTQ